MSLNETDGFRRRNCGHIYPALALIKQVREVEPDSAVLYVGTHKGLENKLFPMRGSILKRLKFKDLNVHYH